MKIYWTRHGEAENNKLNKWNEDPSKKVKITLNGKKQAEIMASKLKNTKIDIIFTSEFPRTQQTAKIINKFHNVKKIKNKLINERKAGYEGKDFFEILPLLKKEILGKGGETIEDFKERVYKFLKNLKGQDYKSCIIVTHMAVLQVVRGLIENLPNKEWRKLKIDHTSIIQQNI